MGIRVGGSTVSSKPCLMLPVTISLPRVSHSLNALIDLGTEQSLIDFDFVSELCLPLIPLNYPITATALNNQVFPQITHRTGKMDQPAYHTYSGEKRAGEAQTGESSRTCTALDPQC